MGGMKRALFIPPIPWQPYRRSFTPGVGPNPGLLDTLLAGHGFEATVLDPYKRPLNPFGGMNSVLQSLDPARALRILTRERSFDIVVSVFEGNAAPLILLRRLFGFKTPIVLWDIGLTESWRLRERLMDFVVPRVEGIMVLASSQKAYIERRWAPKCPVMVIGHSIDTDFYTPCPGPDEGYIFSIGNDASRDYPTLLQAVEDAPEKVILRTNIAVPIDPARHSKLAVLNSPVPFGKLKELYGKARMVVIPLVETLNAGGVSAILEAAAMGKPMIVSNSRVIQDFLIPGQTCLQVPERNPLELRGAIRRLLDEPETRSRLGRSAREFVERTSSMPAFVARLASAMHELSDASRR